MFVDHTRSALNCLFRPAILYNWLVNQQDSRVAKKGSKSVKPHRRKKTPGKGVTFDTVREVARTLPAAEESTSYGTPAFKVKGKLFARRHQDGESLVINMDFAEREEMMSAASEKFYITDHYLNYPYMLVRMSKVTRDELRDLLIGSWRRVAPRNLLTAMS